MAPLSESLVEGDATRSEPAREAEVEGLVRAAGQGDADAFDRLVGLYQDSVFGLAYSLVRDRDEAEDIAQEAFISCFRNLNSFRFESRFSTWLYRITVNHVKNRWKYHQRRQRDRHESLDAPREEDDPRTKIDPPAQGPNPRQTAEGREKMALFEEALESMSLEYRQVLTLRFVENLQYHEIAEILGCSIGTVKSRINRARATLREKMREVV